MGKRESLSVTGYKVRTNKNRCFLYYCLHAITTAHCGEFAHDYNESMFFQDSGKVCNRLLALIPLISNKTC